MPSFERRPSAFASAAICAISIAFAIVSASCGCDEHETAACGTPPDSPITGFRVTTTTGSDSTDANIWFCWNRDSVSSRECQNLDFLGTDEFENGETNAFEFAVPGSAIEVGDLRSIWLWNAGGAFLGNNDWEIVALTVEAQVTAGTALAILYDEPEIDCGNEIDDGEVYQPRECGY